MDRAMVAGAGLVLLAAAVGWAAPSAGPATTSTTSSTGKATTAPAGVSLQVGKKKVTVHFVQDGKEVVPGKDNTVTLAAAPFTMVFDGDWEEASVTALRDPKTIAPMLKADAPPLVIFSGCGMAHDAKSLHVVDEGQHKDSIVFFPATAAGFKEQWGDTAEDAAAREKKLAAVMGKTGQVTSLPRQYLYEEMKGRFTVETFDGKAPAAGDSIRLVVFVQENIDDRFDRPAFAVVRVTFREK